MHNEFYNLTAVGISYRKSSVIEREIFQICRKDIPSCLDYFKNQKAVEGVVIITTCNRLEFYFVLNGDADQFKLVRDFYWGFRHLDIQIDPELFYTLKGKEVAVHLFRVISGLDSMLLGEYQIQGQIKEAYSLACSQKTAEKILHKLFHAAFRTGKMIRSHTKIGSGKQSLSGVAFQIIKEKTNTDDLIVISGVNQNTKIISEMLYGAGYTNLIYVNRTLYKAEEMAERFNGQAFNLEKLSEALTDAKCIFTCTGAPGFIFNSDIIRGAQQDQLKLNLIVDMAVPRDVDPAGIDDKIEIINVEHIKDYLLNQKVENELDIPAAEKIITDEAEIFQVWNESLNNGFLSKFSEKTESIRLKLLDEAREQLSEDELKIMDKFSRSLLHRIKSTINETILSKDNE